MLNTLGVSLTGLNAAKIAVENVSNNIANENTAGYKKRVVQLSEIAQMDDRITGRGVNATSAYRVTSQYMYDKLISENSKVNYYDKLSNMLSNVESIFKETTDTGFSADLSRFYQSVENLRSNPNSQVYKTTLQNQGKVVVESLQNLYMSVEKQQQTEKIELKTNLNDANDIIKQIGVINQKIETYGNTNELLDKRDQLESELSNYVDIKVSGDNGYYELKIAGETVISNNTNVRTINLTEENTLQKDKFNYTKFNTVTNVTDIYDSIKLDANLTPRTFNTGDVVTYKLNNSFEVSVKIGDTIDFDENPLTINSEPITLSNLTRAIVHKINTNSDMKDLVVAYNGDYSVDTNGNKVTNDIQDNYLRIESKFEGTENQFDGRISIQRYDDTGTPLVSEESRESVYKNDSESSDAQSRVYISVFDKEISLKSGSLKAQMENLSSDSSNNKYQVYLDKLDTFAQTLADITDKYIQTGTNTYTYGEAATDQVLGTVTSIGLFSGSSIKTLKFNENLVNDLNQDKLDYLASIQWKTDLSFDGKGQNATSTEKTSLLEFFRDLKVNISSDKENTKFLDTTQKSVKMSIESSYNNLTKVDKDEEMLDLVKFQAAYTANAKIVTIIDEMLQTLLGIKR